MIRLTRINHVPLVLNPDLIEHVEITPDTVIAMTTGQKFMVVESAEEVIKKVIEFRRLIAQLCNLAVHCSCLHRRVGAATGGFSRGVLSLALIGPERTLCRANRRSGSSRTPGAAPAIALTSRSVPKGSSASVPFARS